MKSAKAGGFSLLAASFLVQSLFAQADLTNVQRGEIVDSVRSSIDSTQIYAAYLPGSYDRAKSQPAILIMDPRGRALTALRLFRRAAEEFGCIILSSYRTLSDDPTAFQQNERALAAMLDDVTRRLGTDTTRIYLAGFSGTAHFAWIAAPQLEGRLSGIVGVGGGLPAYSKPIQMAMAMRPSFVYFGIAGIGDFNYDGVRWLDEALDTTRVQHRFVSHDGRHAWPDEEIAYESVRWFHLQAMRNGSIPVDNRFVRDLVSDYMEEARRLENEDDKASAYRRYREIVADFEQFGLEDDALDRFERLAGDQDVLDEQRRRDELSREVQLYKISVQRFRQAHGAAETTMSQDEARKRLRIAELMEMQQDRDYQRSGAARRMLASAHANCGFYMPRQYIEERRFERAVAVLQIAQEIYGRLPGTCYMLAQARAQMGEIDLALDDLECARSAGWQGAPAVFDSDPLLEPLRRKSSEGL